MFRAGIITPECSAWSFPVVIARKKDEITRFYVDYRMLNQRIKADWWPLPNIEVIFEELRGGTIFTTLDLFTGYGQICMTEKCKEMTTFLCSFGKFKLEVMPLGLMNAPLTLQRMMD